MEMMLTDEEIRNHPHVLCRVRAKIHRLAHKYLSYELTPPDGTPPMHVVTYKLRFPGARWVCWIDPDGNWEKHTPVSFAVRMREIIAQHKA